MTSQAVYESLHQHTLRESITCVGVGLHTGKNVSLVVKPADENTGINFLRKDVKPGMGFISGRWYNVSGTEHGTTIRNASGTLLHTVEHLVAALRGCGVDNAFVEVEGPEIPILDGSALPFIQMIEQVGTRMQNADRNIIWIHRPIEYRNGDKYAILMPESRTRITVQIEFDNPLVATQASSFDFNEDDFKKYIAPARTFGFVEQIPELERLQLIKGGSLSNAILVDGAKVLNKDGLRFEDEFVRHKILDCVGDFGLIGIQVLGHYYAKKPGHELNHRLVRTLFNRRDAWSYISLEEYYRLTGLYPGTMVDDQEQKSLIEKDASSHRA